MPLRARAELESEEGKVALTGRPESGDVQTVEICAETGETPLDGMADSIGRAVPLINGQCIRREGESDSNEFLVELLSVTIALPLGVLPKVGHGVEEFRQEHRWLHRSAFGEVEA